MAGATYRCAWCGRGGQPVELIIDGLGHALTRCLDRITCRDTATEVWRGWRLRAVARLREKGYL